MSFRIAVTTGIMMFVGLMYFVDGAQAINAADVTTTVNGKNLTLCIKTGASDTIKDLHFEHDGKLVAADTITVERVPPVGPVPPGQAPLPASWAGSVFGPDINVFGGEDGALEQGKETCMLLTLPLKDPPVAWANNKTNQVQFTNDGDSKRDTPSEGPLKGHEGASFGALPHVVLASTIVGGIAGLLDSPDAAASESTNGETAVPVAVAVATAGLALLGAGGWYARRRFSRN